MFYKVIIALVRFFCFLFFKIRFEGLEHIPREEGFVLSSNHRTYFDPIFAVIRVPRPVRFMAKEELFRGPFGWFISKLGAFPITRGKGEGDVLNHAVAILSEGSPLLVFPEGTRSKTGVPGRAKSGAALIAGRAGVGILPCSIDYGEKLGFRTRITIAYHPLLDKEQLGIDVKVPSTMRAASRMVMTEIKRGLVHLPELEAALQAAKEKEGDS